MGERVARGCPHRGGKQGALYQKGLAVQSPGVAVIKSYNPVCELVQLCCTSYVAGWFAPTAPRWLLCSLGAQEPLSDFQLKPSQPVYPGLLIPTQPFGFNGI